MSEFQQLLAPQPLAEPLAEPLAKPLAEPLAVVTPPPDTVYAATLASLNSGPTPTLLVFDCDYTLYPYDCDKDRIAPFSYVAWSGMHDRHWRPANPYQDVPAIFGAIADFGISVAFLSRNPSAEPLENLLRTLPCDSKGEAAPKNLWATMPSSAYFHAYSSDRVGRGKDRHFRTLRAFSGIPFNMMLFFDDLPENIDAAAKQGTTSVRLGIQGLTLRAFIAGINGWRDAMPRSG